MNKTYTVTIRGAIGKGASLIALVTPDQPGALRALASALPATVGLYSWDVVRGLAAVTPSASVGIEEIEKQGLDPASIVSLTDLSLVAVQALPPRSVVFCANAHAPLSEGGASGARSIQACLNLRDPFGASTRALILACPAWPAPVELGSDVLVVTDEPPADDTRRALVRETVRSAVASGAVISDVDGAVESATRATHGLSGYAVAQAVALSVGATGVDSEALQSRFVSAINAKPGLRYQPADVTLRDVAGLPNMKEFAQALASAREKPGAIVFIDEIEKAIAGSSGQAADSSGASQAILGAILTWMQDEGASGMIALGPPGCLSGDTEIIYRRGKRNSGRKILLSDLYAKFNEFPLTPRDHAGRSWHGDHSTYIQSYDHATGRVFFNRVNQVVKSGVKHCLRMELSTGEVLTLTPDHKVLTQDGYVSAGELIPGDSVTCRGSMKARAGLGTRRLCAHRVVVEGLKYYSSGWDKLITDTTSGKVYAYKRQNRARLVLEAELNKMTFDEYVYALKHTPSAIELKTLPDGCDVHHKNRDVMDDRAENLELLPQRDHLLAHDIVSRFSVEYTIQADVVGISDAGEVETYDISMRSPANNFATSKGLIVHNSGKSLSAKALGSVVGVPTIALDLGALKGSLVGQTEAQTRAALSTITALAGRVFVVATCNSEASLPPELRRRFKQGIWFFDLPTSEERAAIWELYLKRYELPEQPIPASEGWTGAEIASCCESAWSFRITLAKAAQWIVPVAQSAADTIRSLRKNASGRYISASAPGAYVYSEVTAAAPKADASRSFTFDLEEK